MTRRGPQKKRKKVLAAAAAAAAAGPAICRHGRFPFGSFPYNTSRPLLSRRKKVFYFLFFFSQAANVRGKSTVVVKN